MKGIRYLVDEDGHKTAVGVDLKRHAEVWEDLYDTLVAQRRQREPRESLAQVRRRLQRSRKLNHNG